MSNLARLAALRKVIGSLKTPLPFEPTPPTATEAYAGPAGGIERLADVYLPAEPNGTSVLMLHGGGFVMGSRDMKPMRVLAHDLVQAGVTVASVEYRLFPRARVPDQRDDAVLALFWWLDRLVELGLDPARFDLLGCSAGGTLACLANEAAPTSVRRLQLCFPLLDVEAVGGTAVRTLARSLFPGGDLARWSPAKVCQATTPMTVHQGTADQLVDARTVDRVVEQAAARGVSVELHRYEGAAHGFFNEPDAPVPTLARRRIVHSVTQGAPSAG